MSGWMRLVPLLAIAAHSAWTEPAIGAAAPPLSLRQILHAPDGQSPSWAALKGQAVVIEFWATWCTGCREQIAHLNALEQRFRGRPIRFISITDEEPELVSRFMKDYPISGWVGIDAGGRTLRDYGIATWPTTILVDAAGVVRGIGNASGLNAALLETLLAGQPVAFTRTTEAAGTRQTAPEPLFQLMIRPAAPASTTGYSPGAISGVRGRKWETWGVSIEMLLAEAYGIPEDRIESAAAIQLDKRALFDVAVAAPALMETERTSLLRRLLETTFQLSTRTVSRETGVLVLEAVEGKSHRLRPSTAAARATQWGAPGNITAVAAPAAGLAALAARTTGKMVLDETGLAGRYDFELRWDVNAPGAFAQAVHAQLGLRLSPKRRAIDHLVVDTATMPALW